MPGARAVAGLVGEPFRGEVLGYFEVPSQVLGCAGEEFLPEGRLGNRIEREVTTDDGERFCVLLYAFLVEFLLRELAAREIPFRRIDLPEPSFVPPRAGADEDFPLGQCADFRSEALPIERRDALEKIGSRALLLTSIIAPRRAPRLRSTRVPH
jgi:hypothetical protein